MTNEGRKRELMNEDGDANSEERKKQRIHEQSYYKSYENFELHATMISDEARTMTYKRAILANYQKLYKKAVADIGCGTGILSLFCVLAGAQNVYAVENSSFAEMARKVVESNDLQEKVKVISARAEDVDLSEKVDAIVSEWMGYCLLYENMLSSVIDFRDRFLKEDGLMFPETARMFVAALGDDEDKTMVDDAREFWKKMSETYKVNLEVPLADLNAADIERRAHVEIVAPQTLISRESELLKIDLKTVTKEELKCVKGSFHLICFGDSRLCGLVLWFDVSFPGGLILSTSPAAEPTHWQQVIVYFKDPVNVTQDSYIEGEIELKQSEEFHRFMDIEVTAKVYTKDGKAILSVDHSAKLS